MIWTPASRLESQSLHQRHDDEDDREDHQNVDRRAQNMEADPTDQPKDKQNDRNSPEHHIMIAFRYSGGCLRLGKSG